MHTPHPPIPSQEPLLGFLEGPGSEGLISVVIPAFNREDLVVDALESLARQPYKRLQIIVVDDGSVDRTSDVVRAWGDAHEECWLDLIRQPNGGVGAARNAGLRRAEGEFIYFLDSDDLVEPHTLPKMMSVLERNQSAPFALGRVINTDMSDEEIPLDYSGLTHMRAGDILRNHWLLFAALYRRKALRRAGPFNEALVMGEDTEFNWRVLLQNGVGVRCDIVTGRRRHHGHGHLYLDSQTDERMLRSIEMHEALARWISDRPYLRREVKLNGIVTMNNFYHRLGRDEDEELWQRVANLFALFSPDTPQRNAVFEWFTRPENRPKFRMLYHVYRMPRNLISRALKPVARLGVGVPWIERRLVNRYGPQWHKVK